MIHILDFQLVRTSGHTAVLRLFSGYQLLLPCRMSVIHRLAGRLFHRAGPGLGDTGSGEGRHYQPQEELEACCWREFSLWTRTGVWVSNGAVVQALSCLLS